MIESRRSLGGFTFVSVGQTTPLTMTNENSPEENPFEKLFRPPPFDSISALMKADAAGALSDEDFDRHLGWFLGRLLPRTPADSLSIPEPVLVYWATRLVEFNVFNGGFAQAAYNVPEWFELAALGYEQFDRPIAAERIRKAAKLSQKEQASVSWLKRRRAEIRAIFSHFSESSLRALDQNLYEIGWDVTGARIQIARANREAFANLDAWTSGVTT
jgi:Domain of unknown function (DUF4375)